MTPERWQRVEAIFLEIADRPAAEHQHLLDTHCGDDQDLRASVAVLLDADRDVSTDGTLEDVLRGGVELLEGARQRSLPGAGTIGPYRLLRPLGSGGMGEVFLAARDDHEYEKTVAIKLVRPGYDTGRMLDRFRRERQILASLEHPNISRFLDGGTTDDGKPYVVMEHVEGRPIDRYCDDHRLGLRARLGLFRTVCQAVQHAHQRLIVHRDLKPSNILVTDDGTVKLLDFGLAKLLAPDPRSETGGTLASADLTLTVERPLTLAYASPEQVRGERLTTATDVYALGCLLYLLLTGRKPLSFTGLARKEAELRILEEVPPAPSAVVSKTPQVVETGKESGRASATPESVARARGLRPEALRRRLRGDLDIIVLGALRKEPARRPSSVADLAEDVARHLVGLPVRAHRDSIGYRARKFWQRNRLPLVAGAVLITMALGTWWNTLHQARRVAEEGEKAQRVLSFLVRLFEDVDPSQARGEALTVAQLLHRGTEQLDHELHEQPGAQALLSDTIGQVYRSLGLHQDARPLVERALAVRRVHLGDVHLDVASSLNNLGLVDQAAGDYEQAALRQLEALAIYHQLRGDHRQAIAAATNDLGLARQAQGELDEAEALFRRSLDLLGQLDPEPPRAVATGLANLGNVLAARGSFDEARHLASRAVVMGRDLYAAPHPLLARYLNNLGYHQLQLGDLGVAEASFGEALDMRRAVFDENHPAVLESLNNLAALLYRRGDLNRAAELFDEIVAHNERVLGPQHPEAVPALNNLAVVVQRQGDYPRAERLLRRALAIRLDALGESHPDVASSHESLAGLLVTINAYDEARRHYDRALALQRQAHGEVHPSVAQCLANLARLHRMRGDLEQAASLQGRALDIGRDVLGEDHPSVAQYRTNLAEIHTASGVPEAALPLLEQALAQQRASLDPGHLRLAITSSALGRALTDLGRLDEAEPAIDEALRIRSTKLDANHWRLAETRSLLGALRVAQGRYPEAETLLLDAHAALAERRGETHYMSRETRERLVALYDRWQRPDEAARWRLR